MPDTVKYSRFYLQSEDKKYFFAPSGVVAVADEAWCIKDGTFRETETSEGNVMMTFTAFKQGVASIPSQFESLKALRLMLDQAGQVTNGASTRRVLVSSQTTDDINTGELESVVVGGLVKRIDHEIVPRTNVRHALLIEVLIERLPWAERSAETQRFTNVPTRGTPQFTDAFISEGTTNGRIDRLSILPQDATTANRFWRYVWIGIKPNLPAGTQDQSTRFESRVSIDSLTVNRPQDADAGPIDPIPSSETGQYYGSAGARVRFSPAEGSTTSYASWRERFSIGLPSWGTNGDLIAPYMYGKYRLLMRIRIPPSGQSTRVPETRWAVRARLTYGSSYLSKAEWQEIDRTGELYLPAYNREGGSTLAYYDMGPLTINVPYGMQSRVRNSGINIVVDAAMLNIDSLYGTEDKYNSAWYARALWEGYLDFDDFVLVPAESFVHVALPRNIQAGERLFVHVDDYGTASAYVTDKIRTVDDDDNSLHYLKYAVNDVTVGENGFYMPGGYTGNHAIVMVGCAGPGRAVTSSATFSQVEFTVKPREHGGQI